MKKVGLLIVNYNDSKNTINLINNVSNYKVINKIVVVDNKSTDDSLKELAKYESDRIHILEASENKGYGSAINLGSKYLIKELNECFIIVSNTDIVIPNEEVIKSLIAEVKDDIGCAMPKILENDNYVMGWKLTSVNKDILMNIPFINRFYRNNIRYYNSKYFENNNIVDVVHGSFFVIDSNVLQEINFMDENTFLYYEEYILAKKLKIFNKKSVINKDVYVEHKHNQTIGSNINRKNKYKIYKASQLYYEKEYNKANIIQMGLFKLFYYIGLLFK